MAKILKRYEPKKRTGPKAVYPYDTWLDGKIYKLKQGEDFQCTCSSMEGLIRDAAKARFRRVHVYRDDEETIVVQAAGRIPIPELKS